MIILIIGVANRPLFGGTANVRGDDSCPTDNSDGVVPVPRLYDTRERA